MTRPLRTAGGVVLIVAVFVVAGLLGYAETRAARTGASSAGPRSSRSGANGAGATALAAATSAPGGTASSSGAATGTAPVPLPRSAALRRVLGPALAAAALGPGVHAEVRDVATGRVLFSSGGTKPGAPASTAKLLTAAAVLSTRGPEYRIPTRIEYRSGTLALIGGGDPTLTTATGRTSPAYPDAAKLSVLSDAVRSRHLPVKRIVVVDTAFAGPIVSPAWDRDDVPSSYGAGITAVMSDGGRAAPGDVIRSATPDLATGQDLAAQLGSPALPVTRGPAPSGARTIATVRSAPVRTLVAQMLQGSDNVIAECLARQVAMVEHDPVTFLGSARAVRAVVRRLGVPERPGMVDASGLASSDRLTAAALSGALAVIARGADGSDNRLGAVLSGLPVAAWSGTLDDRYRTASSTAAAGVLRAKTGTLTGVTALAGILHDRGGRLLVFAFLADRSGPTPQAEAALDTAAARLARCGCT